MKKKTILYDGDMGGDDLWALAILLGHPDEIEILGIASVFGNVSQPYATRNVCNFLHWLGINHIEVAQGADKPYDGMRPFGDNAYGSDGVGGVSFPQAPWISHTGDIADWYFSKLKDQKDVTILVTGPATNLAIFLQKYPEKKQNIKEIVFMAGGFEPKGADSAPILLKDGRIRRGNITEYAEFNAYQDPNALNIILQSGVACVFMSMDATQSLVLTPARQDMMECMRQPYATAFHRMLMAVEDLDRTKFGVDGPFIHDPNVAVYLLKPVYYKGIHPASLAFFEAPPEDEHRGEALLKKTQEYGSATKHDHVLWLNDMTSPDDVFNVMLAGIKRVIARAP